ncbi:MAG TPA: hypothetical protein VG326_05820 [Tepidisphaeraceae bacterium]|jgi:hypothetical protein|nr:hypothetical protein [Tepidisphaeraceae bacterium]
MKLRLSNRIATRLAVGAIATGLTAAVCAGAAPDAPPAPTKPTTQPTAPPVPQDLASIKKSFVQLANSDWAVRSEALTRLMSLSADALPLLQKAVEESRPVVPAQATVLRQIVTQVFLSGDVYPNNPADGFLGIHMEEITLSFSDAGADDRAGTNTRVVVTDRMPGFPGARTLLDGDVILAILDRPDVTLHTSAEFAGAVKGMGAGATVHFEILRQGRVIRVPVKLDARPLEAEQIMIEEFLKMLNRRRTRAEEYWSTHFAALMKEGVS